MRHVKTSPGRDLTLFKELFSLMQVSPLPILDIHLQQTTFSSSDLPSSEAVGFDPPAMLTATWEFDSKFFSLLQVLTLPVLP